MSRYVDDVCCIVRRRWKNALFNEINNYHPSIKFTEEEESEIGDLDFMDVAIYNKQDLTYGHKIYRKPTQTNQYLHFTSHHPIAHKIGVVDTLLTRAFKLSDKEHLDNELLLTKQILIENGYPPQFINNRLQKVKFKIQYPIPKNNEPKKRIILPWSGEVTSKIAHFLQRNLEIDIGYFPGPKLITLLCNSKQKPIKIRAGVYEIKCKNCISKYVGETNRDFMVRIAEHEYHTRRNACLISPVALHMAENEHEIDKNSYALLASEHRDYFRKFKESIYIRSLEVKMNIQNGTQVNPIWCTSLVNFLKF